MPCGEHHASTTCGGAKFSSRLRVTRSKGLYRWIMPCGEHHLRWGKAAMPQRKYQIRVEL